MTIRSVTLPMYLSASFGENRCMNGPLLISVMPREAVCIQIAAPTKAVSERSTT